MPLQAIARVFRYGQERPTFVYRLCYNGAMQYNIYLRNVNKEALFRRVVDRQTVKVGGWGWVGGGGRMGRGIAQRWVIESMERR